jgi:hypothetical protein
LLSCFSAPVISENPTSDKNQSYSAPYEKQAPIATSTAHTKAV